MPATRSNYFTAANDWARFPEDVPEGGYLFCVNCPGPIYDDPYALAVGEDDGYMLCPDCGKSMLKPRGPRKKRYDSAVERFGVIGKRFNVTPDDVEEYCAELKLNALEIRFIQRIAREQRHRGEWTPFNCSAYYADRIPCAAKTVERMAARLVSLGYLERALMHPGAHPGKGNPYRYNLLWERIAEKCDAAWKERRSNSSDSRPVASDEPKWDRESYIDALDAVACRTESPTSLETTTSVRLKDSPSDEGGAFYASAQNASPPFSEFQFAENVEGVPPDWNCGIEEGVAVDPLPSMPDVYDDYCPEVTA